MTNWSTSSPLPPNTCLIHGSYVGLACPVCSTAAGVPTKVTVPAQPVRILPRPKDPVR